MSSKYIVKSVLDNKEHYRRFVRALRVGISSIYYREDPNIKEILKIYDTYILTYIHAIHHFLRREMEKYAEIRSETMYQNHLALILLFFIIDYERGMKKMGIVNDHIEFPDELVGHFVQHLFVMGFENNFQGITPFRCDLMSIIRKMSLQRIDDFDRYQLLGNPTISIYYHKYGVPVAVPIQEKVAETEHSEIVIRKENEELKSLMQIALLQIQTLQNQQMDFIREREFFRQTLSSVQIENEKLKKKVSDLEEEKFLHSFTRSPRIKSPIIDGFDPNILNLF